MNDKELEKITHMRQAKKAGLNPFVDQDWARDNPDNTAGQWEHALEWMEWVAEYVDGDALRHNILKRTFGSKSPEFLDALTELFPAFSKIRDYIRHT